MASLKAKQSIFILSYSTHTTADKKRKQREDHYLGCNCWENLISDMDVWIPFLSNRFRKPYEIGLMRQENLAVGIYQPASWQDFSWQLTRNPSMTSTGPGYSCVYNCETIRVWKGKKIIPDWTDVIVKDCLLQNHYLYCHSKKKKYGLFIIIESLILWNWAIS